MSIERGRKKEPSPSASSVPATASCLVNTATRIELNCSVIIVQIVFRLFSDRVGLWRASRGGAHCEIREHQPCVNQNVPVPSSDEHAVHANLSKSSYWQDAERVALIRGWSRKLPVLGLL